MAPVTDYETIAPEERLRRIGRLFCKAAILAIARRDAESCETDKPSAVASNSGKADNSKTHGRSPLKSEEFEFLRHVVRSGGIAPREASRFWKVSRATAYRRLSSMEQQGWIVRNGATTGTRYLATAQARDLLKSGNVESGEGSHGK